jgi:hypothetical protein
VRLPNVPHVLTAIMEVDVDETVEVSSLLEDEYVEAIGGAAVEVSAAVDMLPV